MNNLILIALLMGVPAALFMAIVKLKGNIFTTLILKVSGLAYLFLTLIIFLKHFNII